MYYCGIESGAEGEACLEGNSLSHTKVNPIFNESLADQDMAYGQYATLGLNYGSGAGFPTPMKLPPIFPTDNTELRES